MRKSIFPPQRPSPAQKSPPSLHICAVAWREGGRDRGFGKREIEGLPIPFGKCDFRSTSVRRRRRQGGERERERERKEIAVLFSEWGSKRVPFSLSSQMKLERRTDRRGKKELEGRRRSSKQCLPFAARSSCMSSSSCRCECPLPLTSYVLYCAHIECPSDMQGQKSDPMCSPNSTIPPHCTSSKRGRSSSPPFFPVSQRRYICPFLFPPFPLPPILPALSLFFSPPPRRGRRLFGFGLPPPPSPPQSEEEATASTTTYRELFHCAPGRRPERTYT